MFSSTKPQPEVIPYIVEYESKGRDYFLVVVAKDANDAKALVKESSSFDPSPRFRAKKLRITRGIKMLGQI